MTSLKLLDWDSQFFGFRVARTTDGTLTKDSVISLLDNAKKNNIKLIYCSILPSDELANQVAILHNAILVDKKMTYSYGVSKDSVIHQVVSNKIKIYEETEANEKLIPLALQSGVCSRFKRDKNFPQGTSDKLFTIWIQNSVKKINASEVLVYKEGLEEIGLITLSLFGNYVSIGLLAVDKFYQGRTIGRKLLDAALKKSIEWEIDTLKVVTQEANKVACIFYEKYGFKLDKVENIYHFWL